MAGSKTIKLVETSRSSSKRKHTTTWKIENFYPVDTKNGECLYSPEFAIQSDGYQLTKWKLHVYPNGESNKNVGYVSLYLHQVSGPTVIAKAEFSIIGSFGIKFIKRQTEAREFQSQGWGFHTLMDNRVNYTLKNSLKIQCTISIIRIFPLAPVPARAVTGSSSSSNKSDGRAIVQYSHEQKLQQQLSKDMEQLFLEGGDSSSQLSDCKIECQGELISCNMFVLAARSPVFRAMFTNQQHVEAATRTVKIENMRPEVVKDMLYFVYTGNRPQMAQDGAAEELLAAADQYQLDGLKDVCEKQLCAMVSADKAAEYCVLGDMHRADSLKKASMDIIAANMKSVVESEGWKEKLSRCPDLMTEICLAAREGVVSK